MVVARKDTSRVIRLAKLDQTKYGPVLLIALKLRSKMEAKEKGGKDKPKDVGEKSVNGIKRTLQQRRKFHASFLTRATDTASGVIIAGTVTK